MVVYADILILVNFIVDYFLLLFASRFLHKKIKLWRQLLSAAVGGVFSLYIFLPKTNFFIETTVHILTCCIMCVIAFGFYNFKNFCRAATVLFLVNFAYSGAMIAVWLIFKPYGMVINNSVVYFNISPLFLIVFSVIGYFVVVVLRRLLQKNFSQNTYCDVTIKCGQNCLTLCGIADTGNTLKDVFGVAQIFITEQEIVDALLGVEKQNPTRFRKIPCGTVTGESLLDGYRIDHAEIIFEGRKYTFEKPVLAVSTTSLNECKIIINPENLN